MWYKSYHINLYVKRFQYSICIRATWTKTNTEISFSFWLTLFYSIPLVALTHGYKDGQTEERIHLLRVGWRNLFSSCTVCCVSFWFWWEKGFGLKMHVQLRVQYSCGGVLVFWLQWEIVFGVLHILSVQYRCAVVSVFGCSGK
jgi:hypothetical protein